MERIQEIADAECAKYNRIAKQQGGRSSAQPHPVGWASTPQIGQPNFNHMYTNISIDFICEDQPVETMPSFQWPELPKIVP
jgi:hypothetical protein